MKKIIAILLGLVLPTLALAAKPIQNIQISLQQEKLGRTAQYESIRHATLPKPAPPVLPYDYLRQVVLDKSLQRKKNPDIMKIKRLWEKPPTKSQN